MASWNEIYRFGGANEVPQWMRMNVETSSPRTIYYPHVEDPEQRHGYYDSEYNSGYKSGYNSGYLTGYHHSDYQPGRPAGHQSNHQVWWTPPTAYDPPECRMLLNVPICCDGCHERVTKDLSKIEGVRAVNVDRAKREVPVSGTFVPKEILNACTKLFKRSKWQPT